jgi:glycosyltransferase involved in cell wall biosynthesis
VAAYAGNFLKIPSVVSIRGNDIERAAFDPAKFSHVMYALQNASAVTTNASELAKKAKAFLDREIVLVPNGIDTELFRPMERNEGLAEALELDAGGKKEERKPVIGFAGELREKKGLTTLLAGYAKINKERPSTLLIVGGVRDGEDNQFFNEFRNSNPESRIFVTGPIPHKDMPAYYSLMDVFVHPSLRDGMPNALLEAMACGIPVVSTPVGGALDVIQDGHNGLIVPIHDADALCQSVSNVLADGTLSNQLTQMARRTIVEKYSPVKELTGNLAVYRNLGVLP